MKHILDKAFTLAVVVALVWTALAVHLAAQTACAGPTVALVKPFGGALAAAATVGSGS